MPERTTLILATAHGRDLVLDASQLLEVLPAGPIEPLPGPVPGIAGVILYEGEFMPVLDWRALPGPSGQPGGRAALAILRRRLALPLDSLAGAMDRTAGDLRMDPPGDDPWADVMSCQCSMGGASLPMLDPDKLVVWLHHRRSAR